jgi:hypothetical protein
LILYLFLIRCIFFFETKKENQSVQEAAEIKNQKSEAGEKNRKSAPERDDEKKKKKKKKKARGSSPFPGARTVFVEHLLPQPLVVLAVPLSVTLPLRSPPPRVVAAPPPPLRVGIRHPDSPFSFFWRCVFLRKKKKEKKKKKKKKKK